ncbi:hypothetical protein ACFL1A_01785 [Patescibacteria group bacterium]
MKKNALSIALVLSLLLGVGLSGTGYQNENSTFSIIGNTLIIITIFCAAVYHYIIKKPGNVFNIEYDRNIYLWSFIVTLIFWAAMYFLTPFTYFWSLHIIGWIFLVAGIVSLIMYINTPKTTAS